MPHIDFLSADTALVKTFTLKNGQVEKSPYPMVRDFTSHRREVMGIEDLFKALNEGADQGWCLSKGPLNRAIANESRAGTTDATDQTQILVLDFDGLPGFRDVDAILTHIGLAQYSHIIQWSASAWVQNSPQAPTTIPSPKTSQPTPAVSRPESQSQATDGSQPQKSRKASGLRDISDGITAPTSSAIPIQTQFSLSPGQVVSAHVFMWIDHPVAPSLMKAWLQKLNMERLATSITLTRTGAALHWPIDPSVSDNSKLIYIAPPRLLGGLQPPSPAPSISMVERKISALPSTLFTVNPQEVTQERALVLAKLRTEKGLKPLKDTQYKIQNGQLYMSKPGEATITGKKIERGFVYLNLNGGDSWGYYHPEDNAEYIFNFKGEPIYKTAELLPEYWASINKVDATRPEGKVRYFVCRDFRTDRLYNGMHYVDEDRLDMARASNEGRLRSFLKQHGQPVSDFVPDFSITYNPHDKRKFDIDARFINTYVPSRFEAVPRREQSTVPPMIEKVIQSAVGAGDTFEHFVNWLADIVQYKEKIGTAWCLHGNEGTGKGVLFHKIITPILGEENVASITMRALDSPFNGFMERALAVFVDEVQIPALKGSLGISANLRNFITEQTVSIRRMYTEPYNAPNYTNFIFASNMPDPLVVPPTDRRFHVGVFQASKIELSDADLKAVDKEVEDFYMYLAGYMVNRSLSRTILQSEDRERLQKLSQTAADTMASVILTGDIEDLVVNLPQNSMLPSEAAYTALVKRILAEGGDKLTRDELLTIFQYRVGDVPESPNKFTSFLKHHRIYTSRIRVGERLMYGVPVTWNKDREWMQETLRTLAQPPVAAPNVSSIRKAKVALQP